MIDNTFKTVVHIVLVALVLFLFFAGTNALFDAIHNIGRM